jgi:RHS repeat-associated protein
MTVDVRMDTVAEGLFATYTRDSATGLDYANQRYYSSVYGRFNTVDPYIGSVVAGIPGSWNRYSYVINDPSNHTDTSGLYVDCDGSDDSCDLAACGGDPVACALDAQNASSSGDDGGNTCSLNPYDVSCEWTGGPWSEPQK